MCRDGERSEVLRAHAVLVHVGAHQLRVQRQERFAAAALELLVRGRCERTRDGVSVDVRHLLYAADHDDVVRAARDREVTDSRGGAPRSARGLDGERLYP